MQKIFTYLFFLLACSSCAKFQYSTISSNTTKTPDGIHVFENDSILIRYSFTGYNCPLDISVFNKLSVPLFIDWKKSSVIINQQRFPLWIDQSEIKAHTEGTIQWTQWSGVIASTNSTTTGSVLRSESTSFIPPKSFVTMKPVTLRNELFNLDRKNATKTMIKSPSMTVPGYGFAFKQEDSPMVFRSYLVVSTAENFLSPTYLEHEFWVSHVLETALTPKNKPLSGNQFLTKKIGDEGTGVLAILGIVGLALVLRSLAQ
jgi:hypothetical protein